MQPEAVFTSDELTFIASKFVRKSLYSRATNSFIFLARSVRTASICDRFTDLSKDLLVSGPVRVLWGLRE